MDHSSDVAMLQQTLAETQAELTRAQHNIASLERMLQEIEEYGTEEINAAVELRQMLARANMDVAYWKGKATALKPGL